MAPRCRPRPICATSRAPRPGCAASAATWRASGRSARPTLEITLAAPQATFLVKLTHTTAAVVDARQTGAAGWWKRPNGSGPFQLSEWNDGDRLVLTRFARYHDGPATLERVVWLLGANASQPLNLYEGGKIDLTEIGADSIDRALVPGGSLNKDLRITPQFSLTYLAFNVTQPPFDDPKVRQALVARRRPRKGGAGHVRGQGQGGRRPRPADAAGRRPDRPAARPRGRGRRGAQAAGRVALWRQSAARRASM